MRTINICFLHLPLLHRKHPQHESISSRPGSPTDGRDADCPHIVYTVTSQFSYSLDGKIKKLAAFPTLFDKKEEMAIHVCVLY